MSEIHGEAGEGEGERRRRRRRGGRGRDRGEGGERAERTPHEATTEGAAQSEMFDHAASEHRPARVTQPLGETRTEATQEQTPIPPASSAAPAPAPRAPAAAPVAFREVSQHDESQAEESAHKPVRRRRRGGSDTPSAQEASLQLVETQSELAASTPAVQAEEEESTRRPVRRRRRGSSQAAPEPLQMVETAPGAEASESQPPAP